MLEKYKFNYSYLRGWIKQTFHSDKKYAYFLGISPQALNKKFNGGAKFSTSQIQKTKEEFLLTPDEVALFYFNIGLKNETFDKNILLEEKKGNHKCNS